METVKTMTDQRDIYRSAKLLIDRYGYDDAKLHSAELADAMLERGDMDGRRICIEYRRRLMNWAIRSRPALSTETGSLEIRCRL